MCDAPLLQANRTKRVRPQQSPPDRHGRARPIRYLLARILLKPPLGKAFVIAWSLSPPAPITKGAKETQL
jgi:hypothetical protein